MNPILTDALLQRKAYLEQIISDKTAALEQDLPAGRLRCNSKKGVPEFYCVTTPGDQTGKYIRKKDFSQAKKLAQKDYDQAALKRAASELKSIDRLLGYYAQKDVDSLYEKLSPVRRDLVLPVKMTDEQFVQNWLEYPYERKPFSKNDPEYYTAKGERVRSKSEILIADTLSRMNIPYRFEFPINIFSLGTVHPDFMALNVRLRKAFFWEHLGKMDDPDYCENNVYKLYCYSQSGILPGDNLLLTYETKNNPLNTRLIIKTIKHYLL